MSRILVLGATGVIGRRIVSLLVDAGHAVAGTTRTPSGIDAVRHLGAEPIVVDVFDRDALIEAVRTFTPDVILNELTDLPDDAADLPAAAERNARIRTEGNRNVIAAARASGSPRLLVQSVAWPMRSAVSADAVADLERTVLAEGGVVLAYGQFTGPGTYYADRDPGGAHVSVQRAAERTVELLDAPSGVIVITD